MPNRDLDIKAKQGNAEAQLELGNCYYNGAGVEGLRSGCGMVIPGDIRGGQE